MMEQRRRLTELGVQPHPAPATDGAPQAARKAARGGSGAFERGIAALRQYKEREKTVTVPRGHVEVLENGVDGTGDSPVEVKLGIWLSNTKTRRDRLTPHQLTALAELGLKWARTG